MALSSCAVAGVRGATRSDFVLTRLSNLLGRFGRKSAGRLEEDAPAPSKASGLFSASAVGIITNYGDQYFSLDLHRRLRATGIAKIVYSGPLATIDDPRDLWGLIQSGEVLWVYGQADVPRSAPELGELPAGPAEIEVNGVLFRHFVPGPEPGSRRRYGECQWPPPGRGRDEAMRLLSSDVTQSICVIGSGLEYERWVPESGRGGWELVDQSLPASIENPVAEVALAPDERHIIVHPTSRGQYCSVIDPEQHRIVLFLV